MKTPHLLSAALLLGVLLPAQNDPKAPGAIQVDDLKAWLATLTSPEFGGRGTGQDGFKLAAEFMRKHYQELGLVQVGDAGDAAAPLAYFQEVPWSGTKVVPDKTSVVFQRDGKDLLKIPAERLSGSISGPVSGSGEAVLLVLDMPSTESGGGRRGFRLEGLEDLDVEGKVVVAWFRQPLSDQDRMRVSFGLLRGLQGKSPAGMLIADHGAKQTSGLTGASGGRGGNRAVQGQRRLPAALTFAHVDTEVVRQMAGELPATGTKLVPLKAQCSIEVATEETKLPAFNVIAVLPGSDPKLKDEYVVIGSHLDHLGRRGETFFPGADDDGSGTVGVLAVAKAFANSGKKPRRSILFVNFCGEENGLIGSRFFVENPPIPLSSIVAELQMDMIGRDEEENMEGNRGEKAEDNRNSLHLVGTQKLSPALHELCLKHNETAKLDLEYDQEGMYGRSDHANFGNKGIPIAFFFTGLHRDYHQPSDTAEKINYEKLARIADYVFAIARDLADSDDRPHVDPALWAKNGRGGEPAAPLRKETGAGR